MELYANLHSHSTHSDGVYTPAELVRIAKEEGYGAVAVTDHDTITGFPELRDECEKLGMEYIFGAEFSTQENFHIVGFDFDPEEPNMKRYLWEMSERETNETKTLVERGLSEGLISGITWEEVVEYNKGITWLCNDHVFAAMKAKGVITDAEYPNFFDTVFGDRRGEVPLLYPWRPVKDTIKLIKNAGGIAIVAHPANQLHRIKELMEYGLDGLEVWHHALSEEKRREAFHIAMENNLYISGGSDHEGILGGQYERYECPPEETPFYAPEKSLGTAKIFFDEIKNRKLSPDRKNIEFFNKRS